MAKDKDINKEWPSAVVYQLGWNLTETLEKFLYAQVEAFHKDKKCLYRA